MKPTVIANKTENQHSTNLPSASQSDANNNNCNSPISGGNAATGAGLGGRNDYRGYGQPSAASHGFPYDDSDDDIFSDMGLRARLNRMGHNIPFDWGARKRRGSGGGGPGGGGGSNQFEQYFHEDDDFPGFPSHWGDTFGRMNGRKRNPHAHTFDTPAQDRSGFFDYLPPEFRQYIPDSFVYQNRQPQSPSATRSPPVQRHQPVYAQQVPQQPTSPTRCDAAIQTDDSSHQEGNTLNQHGLRNTVDLGQKSPSEQIKVDRSHSAPPTQTSGSNLKKPSDFFHTQYQRIPADKYEDIGTCMTPQMEPHVQPHFVNQYEQPSTPKQQSTPTTAFQRSTSGQENVRTIPIFIEGHDKPVTPKIIPPSHQQTQQQQPQSTPPSGKGPTRHQHRPEPFVGIGQQPQQQQPQQQYQQQQQQHPQQQTNTQQQPPITTPQTPHTTDCIFKIQAIQRDVLNLMEQVEKFSGTRADKEYMHLDEMLTINLLKLDNIDTNGRERIRLARKEAIKCIQASIAVLEAKAEQKTNEIQDEQTQQTEENQQPEGSEQVPQNEEKLENEELKSKESGAIQNEVNNENIDNLDNEKEIKENIEFKSDGSVQTDALEQSSTIEKSAESEKSQLEPAETPVSPTSPKTKHRSEVKINLSGSNSEKFKDENGCASETEVGKDEQK